MPDVDRLLESLSYRDLREWQAYDTIEPFGDRRADLRSAQLCALIANVVPTEEDKDWSAEDFMPEFHETETERRRKKQEKAKQMRSKFRQMF